MLGQRPNGHAQPLGRNRPQTGVEVRACTIQINTEDECAFGHVRELLKGRAMRPTGPKHNRDNQLRTEWVNLRENCRLTEHLERFDHGNPT